MPIQTESSPKLGQNLPPDIITKSVLLILGTPKLQETLNSLPRKYRCSDAVDRAFAIKEKEIAAIVDSKKSLGLSNLEVANQCIPEILRELDRSDSLRSEYAKNRDLMAAAISSKLQDWQGLCMLSDRKSSFNIKKVQDLLKPLKSNLGKIVLCGNQEQEEQNQELVEELVSMFMSLSDPLEIMRHSSLFVGSGKELAAFELDDAIFGVFSDYYRTKQFVSGVIAAVKDLERKFPEDQVIRIADLGSGPFGILGLVALATSKKVQVDFVEVEPSSKLLLDTIIQKLKLGDRAKTHLINFFDWQPEEKLHAVLSETMNAGFVSEPLPKVSQYIRKDMLPEGIIIPQEVTLRLAPIPSGAALTKKQIPSCIPVQEYGLKFYDPEFSSLPMVFNTLTSNEQRAAFILPLDQIPNGKVKLVLLTAVKVFKGFEIEEDLSIITCQQGTCFCEITPELKKQHKFLVFSYELGQARTTSKLEFANRVL